MTDSPWATATAAIQPSFSTTFSSMEQQRRATRSRSSTAGPARASATCQ
jgi:hypothetical protein